MKNAIIILLVILFVSGCMPTTEQEEYCKDTSNQYTDYCLCVDECLSSY